MMANKPRNSVLYLFDPLESVSTPRRDGSPDSSTSDKENDVQQGEVTMFFNRIYASQKTAAPKTPNGKLIDIGDTTTDDVWGLEEEENAPSLAQVFKAAKHPVETFTERVPLADIEIEEISRPVRTETPLATSPFNENGDATLLGSVSAAPTGAPLADVINSINLSAMDISGSEPPSPLANHSPLPPLKEEADTDDFDEDEAFQVHREEPEDTVCIPLLITVSSPTGTYEESNSLTDMVLPPSSESPTDRLFASSNVNVPPTTRRPTLKTRIANDDPRRASVDLQASFSMQMQSAEMSFDLLNDRISFHAGDSMWVGGDDEDEAFDMATEMKKMEAAANVYERAEQGQKNDIATEISATSPDDQDKAHDGEWADPYLEDAASRLSPTDKPESPTPSPVATTPPKVFEAAPSSVSATSGTLTKRDRSLSIQMLSGSPTPAPVTRELPPPLAPVVPALVPALRIVKKTWKVHGRMDSGTSSGSSVSSGNTSTNTSRTRSTSPDTSVASDSASSLKDEKERSEPARPRVVVRGVQRPPAGAEVSGNRVVVPLTSTSTTAPTRTTAPTAQAKSRASLAREASARFAAAGLQRPNLQQGQRAPPASQVHKVPAGPAARTQKTTSASSVPPVPRPTSIGRAVGAGVAARVAGTSGLKAPAVSGIPSSKSSSALPRPASRLPAPSVGARVAKASAPATRVPSAGARRAF